MFKRISGKDTKKENDIDFSNLPKHIAVVMDGNGRWAKKRGLPRTAGHKMGIEALKRIVDYAGEIKIDVLTVYAFSTENWKRPAEEVRILMGLIIEYIKKELDILYKNGVKINPIGNIDELPEKTREEVNRAKEVTKNNDKLILNVALNYGSRDEIINGVKEIISDLGENKINFEDIDEDMFSNYLYTRGIPDPDLVIRPSGEKRLSNYLLWQSAYSEFYFDSVLWPDFTKEDLDRAILEYQKRDRRFGAVK